MIRVKADRINQTQGMQYDSKVWKQWDEILIWIDAALRECHWRWQKAADAHQLDKAMGAFEFKNVIIDCSELITLDEAIGILSGAKRWCEWMLFVARQQGLMQQVQEAQRSAQVAAAVGMKPGRLIT